MLIIAIGVATKQFFEGRKDNLDKLFNKMVSVMKAFDVVKYSGGTPTQEQLNAFKDALQRSQKYQNDHNILVKNLDTKDDLLTALLDSATEEEKVVIRILESLKAVDPLNRLKRFNLQK